MSSISASLVSVLPVLFAMGLTTSGLAQGSLNFKVTIAGAEIVRGQQMPVVGDGSLQLFGRTMNYHIFVPINSILPAEAHFHGPRVDSDMPMFSLAPFSPQSTGGIVYRGTHVFESKYLPDIHAGNWYINLHSPNYVNAVLSGYIMPVPEPGTLTLIGVGLCVAAVLPQRLKGSRAKTSADGRL